MSKKVVIDCWKYFDDKFKIYVPKNVLNEFEIQMKRTKVNLIPSAEYYKGKTGRFEAKDFIFNGEYKNVVIKTLRKLLKEKSKK